VPYPVAVPPLAEVDPISADKNERKEEEEGGGAWLVCFCVRVPAGNEIIDQVAQEKRKRTFFGYPITRKVQSTLLYRAYHAVQ